MDDQILDDKARQEIPVEINQLQSSPKRFWSKYKIIIAAISAVILIVGIFWFFLSWAPSANNLTSENVLLQIKGPSQSTSGNEAEYTVIYRNGENADLVGISLEMFYPTGFTFKSATPAATSSDGQTFNLPILKQGEEGRVTLRGKLLGATSEDKEIKARLHYRLSNFNSQFAISQSIHTQVLAPDLVMEINGPVDVVNGQDMTFTVTLTNVSTQNFDNLAVQLTFPDGFGFTSSDTAPTKNNNYWKLNALTSNSSQSIQVTGSFSGVNLQEKLVRADLGQVINDNFAPQISTTASFRIIPSSLALSLTALPVSYVKLGDTINYKLKYANQGSIGLSNLVVTVSLAGPSVDFSRISAENAIVAGQTLTWKAATLSNLSMLSPNEQGEISFTVPVKSGFSTNLKNQTIKASVTISSDEINNPTKAADLELKIISQLGLTVSGDYISGAAPMQVGQTTLIAMTFLLTNLSNDLIDTEVVASLPLPASTWNNVIVPDSEASRLSFDPNSGKIRWKLGNVPAFTGKFIPALKATFQLAVTPTEGDSGKVVKLLGDVQATGTDTFVNQSIQSDKLNSVTVSDIDDDVLNSKGTNVQ